MMQKRMVRAFEDIPNEAKTPADRLKEQGVYIHLFAESAEGIRAPVDKDLAARRAELASTRLPLPSGDAQPVQQV
jgi:hypothetical protein